MPMQMLEMFFSKSIFTKKGSRWNLLSIGKEFYCDKWSFYDNGLLTLTTVELAVRKLSFSPGSSVALHLCAHCVSFLLSFLFPFCADCQPNMWTLHNLIQSTSCFRVLSGWELVMNKQVRYLEEYLLDVTKMMLKFFRNISQDAASVALMGIIVHVAVLAMGKILLQMFFRE